MNAGSILMATSISYSRSPVMKEMEKLLLTWLDHQNKLNVPVRMSLIQVKAKSTYYDLEGDDKKAFNASSGWFANFRKRYGYHNIKMTGEVASADKKAAEEYHGNLKTIIEEGDYSAKHVFSIDETGLYWKKLPNRTYISVEESKSSGFKASKDWVTVMLGCDAESDKLKPVLIYHSENPRALKIRKQRNVKILQLKKNIEWK